MKRILLVGAGHAHAGALAAFARQPLGAAQLTVVAPHERQIYSGMLPGVIAGHFHREEAEFDAEALASRAGARFVKGSATALDPLRRCVSLEDGQGLEYDILSLNVGSTVDTSLAGSAQYALPVKPFERLAGVADYLPGRHVAIVGGGAAGCELAMAMRHAGAEASIYAEHPALGPRAQRRLAARLRRLGISFIGNPATAIEEGPVVVSGTSRADYDLVVLAAGATPLAWLRDCGLASDERGFIAVDAELRSTSHRQVFAVGDCATLNDSPHPKSGVFSVRHGELLARNLRHLVSGADLEAYRPQRRALVLLTCGDKYAIAERGAWSAEGRWAWWWKKWIDRRWLKRLKGPDPR